jgi:parvulin-like peptidyl-prolyl isomerase
MLSDDYSLNTNNTGGPNMVTRLRVLAVALLTAGTALQANAEIVDAIVATVDTEVILRSDVMSEIRPFLEGMPENQRQAEGEEIFTQALEQAIEQKILYREGVLNDIKITDEQVESRISVYRDRYDTEKDFLDALADTGQNMGDFREQIRKQTVALAMGVSKRRYLERDVVISEAELAQHYQDNIDEFQKPERLKLYRIFIASDKVESNRSRTQAQLEALRDELALGAEFSQLAKQHSQGPFAEEGGFAGWFERGDLQQELEDVAFDLNGGDVSPIIETETGMMLLMVAEKVEAGLASFDEMRTELEPVLRASRGDDRYRRWMAELRKRSRVRKYQ